MANKAKPLYLKNQELLLKKEALIDRAVDAYRAQTAKPGTREWKGYRTITVEIIDQYEEETKSRSNPRGERIDINWTTVRGRDEGTRSLLDARAQDALLTSDEDNILTEFLQECSDRGFPANNKRIVEAALEIIQKRRPEIKKLSHHWLSRFLNRKKARKQLQVYWSKSLKTDRGRAVNLTTHREYFRLLQRLFEEHQFEEDCIWGGDESAFQKGVSEKERVIGRHGKKVQHQIRAVDRENTTVICTICADGSSISPLVIFKGTAFRVKWLEQNNPQNATLAYQRKGWTDHKLGVEWINDFDRKSKDKANGWPRLLLVDGHSSHYTYDFLRYAADHNIIVVCYPAHSTHIYQGLDMVCFGAMKKCWQEECMLQEERSGGPLTKDSFLEIFSKAYIRAFTPETVRSAFRKTGVWPLNPSVVGEREMAPSVTFSTLASSIASSLVTQSSPVQKCLDAVDAALSAAPSNPTTSQPPSEAPHSPNRHSHIGPLDPHLREQSGTVVGTLTTAGFGYLLSSSPPRTLSMTPTRPHIFAEPGPLPDLQLFSIEPDVSPRGKALLKWVPETETEAILLDSLRAAHQRESNGKKRTNTEMTRNVLNTLQTNKLQKQLNHQDMAKKRKRDEGNMMLTGNAICLTAPEMIANALEARERKAAEEAAKLARKAVREREDELRKAWTEADKARKVRNIQARAFYKREMDAYTAEKARCRQERIRFSLTKPTLHVEPAVPKPWLIGSRDLAEPAGGLTLVQGGGAEPQVADASEEEGGGLSD